MSWRPFALILCTMAALAQEESGTSKKPYTVEKVLGGLKYASAVGWFKDHLLISDLPAGKITKIDTEGPSTFRENTHATALAADAENRVYIADAHEHRLIRLDRKGKVDVLASTWENQPLLGPTGITVGKNNSVWFTDSAWASEDQKKARPYYAVFHVSAKGELSLVAKMNTRPNGIAVSPDNKTLYVVDSDARSVLSWDLDRTGMASNQKVFVKTRSGVPNGVAVAPDGTVYVASRNIEVFTPAGQPMYYIEITEKPADITTGDTGLSNLYVAARTGLYRVRFGGSPTSASASSKGGGAN
jgi:gluconolactonase